jgi:hypothetical protein
MCRGASGSSLDDGSTKAMHPDNFAAPASKRREALADDEARTVPVNDASGEDVEWGGMNHQLRAHAGQGSRESQELGFGRARVGMLGSCSGGGPPPNLKRIENAERIAGDSQSSVSMAGSGR